MKSFLMTKKTHEELQKRKESLEKKMISLTEEVVVARERGDLRENAEYNAARSSESDTRRKLEETINKLRFATVIDLDEIVLKDSIVFGCTVLLLDEKTNQEVTYTLLGEEEASILDKKISCDSPLGRNLLGKKKNDSFSFSTPNGIRNYQVKDFYLCKI